MKTNTVSFPVNYLSEIAKFVVRPAQKSDLPIVVKLFNSGTESALALTPKALKDHLKKDPAGILLGFLDNQDPEPLTMVGITKVVCAKASDMPSTYEALNPNKTDPSGNLWICTWAGIDLGRGEGWIGTHDQRTLNLGQLTFAALTKLAQETKGKVDAIIDFARPKGLNTYLQKKGYNVRFTFTPGEVVINGRYMQHDKNGLFYIYGGKTIRVLDMQKYWVWGEDPVLNFHTANGAVFNRKLVFPIGDDRDQESLFFRFGFYYPVIK